MKILHTADLHLSNQKKQTVTALETILNLANELDVDLITISGDIFDSPEDADNLRPKLRTLLSNLDFPIISIPGNHDEDCYNDDLDFGSNFKIQTKRPLEVLQYDDVTIVAFPYVSKKNSELLSKLRKAKIDGTKNILLIHCTLDSGYSTFDMGNEGEGQYFPIKSSTLAELGYNYILAGHFHSNRTKKRLENGGYFVYPGSPCSITKKETGKRSVFLLDTVY